MDRLRILCLDRQVRQMLCIFLLLAVSQGIVGRDYRTSILRQAAEKLGIEQQIDKAPEGKTSGIATSSGPKVAVRIDTHGTVEHIGLPLFSTVMRKETPSPVYDCLESALLDRCVLLTENDLLLQKIQFYKGSWKTLFDILPSDACSITTQDKKYYQVVWSRNGGEIANVVVPIDYELLSTCSRRELEKNFVQYMARYQADSKSALPKETDPQLAKAAMQLEMQLSSYERQTVSVPLRQWISYCESQGCTTSIKYVDSDEAIVKAYVLEQNDAMGYHHLLELNWQTEELDSPSPQVKGKALLFIPNNDKI